VNAAEMNVRMVERLDALVKRHKLAGGFHQAPGDVPYFLVDDVGIQIIANPDHDTRFDIWRDDMHPIRFNASAADVLRIITRVGEI
jgi:hypothetical protein